MLCCFEIKACVVLLRDEGGCCVVSRSRLMLCLPKALECNKKKPETSRFSFSSFALQVCTALYVTSFVTVLHIIQCIRNESYNT